MKNFFMKSLINNNISLTQRICYAGILIALTTIAQKVFAINYIQFIPFLRLSLGGPCLIIFTSIFLGPWFGLLCGAFSDILGYFIFDMSSFPYFFQVTLIYALLGFASYYVFKLIKRINNTKVLFISEIALLLMLLSVIGITLFTLKDITLYGTTYTLELWQKIAITGTITILGIICLVFVVVRNKKYQKNNESFINPTNISFGLLIIELVILTAFGSTMKAWAFGFGMYGAILLTQIITLFFNFMVNTLLLELLLRISLKRFANQGELL